MCERKTTLSGDERPVDPDSTPTIRPGDENGDPDEQHTVKARKIRKKVRPKSQSPEMEEPPTGSITAHLRSRKGIRGDVDLPEEGNYKELIWTASQVFNKMREGKIEH